MNKDTKKYGNDRFWAFIPEGHGFGINVEIWENIGLGQSETIALSYNKFSAMKIVDSLTKDVDKNKNLQ